MHVTAITAGTLQPQPTTLRRVRSLVESGVAYLPSHDPESPTRL